MKTYTHTLCCFVAFAAAWVGAGVQANADTLLFSRGGGDRVIGDDSYDFLSEDQFAEPQFVAAQYSVLYGLYAGLEYTYAEETFEPFLGLSTDLDVHGFLATVRLEHQLTQWFVPYMQLGVGAYYISLEADFEDDKREQGVWELGMVQLAGLELMIPRPSLRRFFKLKPGSTWWDFTMGLGLEAGYQHMGTVEFDKLERPEPDKKPDPDEALLPGDPISYGTVDLSGFMLRFGLHVHF